jgi:hypothetical protein
VAQRVAESLEHRVHFERPEHRVESEDRVRPVLELRCLEPLGVVEHDLADLERTLLRHGGDAGREQVDARPEVQELRGDLEVGVGGVDGLADQRR